MQLPGARFAVNGAALRHLQLEICVELHRLVPRVAFAVGEPADHPAIDLFARVTRRSVLSRADEETYAVPGAVELVPAARLRVDCSRAIRTKVVVSGRHHQPWKRRRHFEEVRYIETACEQCGKAHFRIGRGTGEQSAERIDKAARRGRFDARLEDADIGRDGAAARAAGYADAIRVDVGAAD